MVQSTPICCTSPNTQPNPASSSSRGGCLGTKSRISGQLGPGSHLKDKKISQFHMLMTSSFPQIQCHEHNIGEKKKKYTVARRKTLILATLWYFKCRRQQGKGLGAKVILSVQFSRSVVSNSLRPHGLQHTRLPCPSPTPGVYPNSCPLSR